jgi:hypothetical protein
MVFRACARPIVHGWWMGERRVWSSDLHVFGDLAMSRSGRRIVPDHDEPRQIRDRMRDDRRGQTNLPFITISGIRICSSH